MTDYYKVLEISRSASSSELKKAYRKMALKFHPDKNNSANSKELFILIHEAYQILSDPELRRKYDSIINDNEAARNYNAQTTTDNFKKQTREARQQADIYADDYDLFSKQVLKNNLGIFFLAIIEILFGGLSANSIGLFIFGFGLIFILVPFSDNEHKPDGLYWVGGFLIVWGMVLVIRRWQKLAKELGEQKNGHRQHK